MSPPCLHRHISFAEYRLNVFRRLFFTAPVSPALSQNGFSQHKNGSCKTGPSLLCRRTSGQKTEQSRHFGSDRNIHLVQPKAREESMQEKRYPSTPSKPKGNGTADVTGTEEPYNLFTESQEIESRGLQDGTTGSTSNTDVDIDQESATSVWTPLDARLRGELSDLVTDLERLTEDVAVPLKELAKESAEKGRSSIRFDMRNTLSPLERSQRAKHRQEPKRQPTAMEQDRVLARNPWAQMLASPIRYCSASKARLPRDLMDSWGIVRNPMNNMDYLTPVEASDLNLFRDNINDTKRKKGSKLPDGERVFITPNRLLIRAITEQVVRQPSAKKPATKTVSSILSANLIPFRWRNAAETASAFRESQKRFNDATGVEDSGLMQSERGLPDLQQVQWQHDIPWRLQNIFSERVLIALDAVATNNATNEGVRARRVTSLPLPEDGELKLKGGKLLTAEQLESLSHRTEEHPEQDLDPSPPASRNGIPASGLDWTSGSFLLHVGSPERYLDRIQGWYDRALLKSAPTVSLPELGSDLIPPCIAVDSGTRLPVFNLVSLLGPVYAARVRKLTFNYGMLDWRLWQAYESDRAAQKLEKNTEHRTLEDERPSALSTPPEDYLILIKTAATSGPDLLCEIWRQWRFIGGKPGLFAGDVQIGTNPNMA